MQRRFDTTKLTGRELTRALDDADHEAGSTDRTTRWEGETLVVDWPDKAVSVAVSDKTVKVTMGSPIDRIKAKALQARAIAPTAIKEFEADLDALIAEGPKLKADQTAAVSKHTAAFKGIRDQFDGLHSAIDILSNGGDPLDESTSSAHGS